MKFASGILGSIQGHHTRKVHDIEDFFDGLAACLCSRCRDNVKAFFEHRLTTSDLTKLYPVSTGASGVAILTLLGYGGYIAPRGKPWQPKTRNMEWATLNADRVALVDDCIVTGGTMNYMREVLAEMNIIPVAEIVLMGARPNA